MSVTIRATSRALAAVPREGIVTIIPDGEGHYDVTYEVLAGQDPKQWYMWGMAQRDNPDLTSHRVG